MQTETEIEIKKVRKLLQKHSITEDEKESLRNKLSELKEIVKIEKTKI